MDWENRTVSLLLCLSILLATIHNGNAERKIVCYYTSWSIYRPGTAKFSPQNINPYLCTHLIYAFGGFTKDNALKPFDKYQDIEKGGYAKFNGLKTYNKNLKTLLAIGGWNEGSSRFSPMFADPDRRREFVKNTIKFLRKNHFDGLDLDWEYPASREGGKPRDKDNYASLVQELREEFERESSKTGRPRLLVSLAMPAGIEHIEKGYDIPRLNEYLDFINLLSYDYHSSYDPAVNHHAPLYPLEEDNEYSYDTELTIDYTVNYLLKNGATPEKLVLGIPTYGRTYTLFNQDATDLGSPADGPGTKGDATGEKGYLAYYEICENLEQSDDWEVVQPNPKAMGPYAYKGDQWVGYDDVEMVRLKAKYANEKKLGGIMFWTIDNDDFRGKCHGRPYPLIETAKETLLTDSSTNAVQKSKATDSRKKIRVHGAQSNTVARRTGSNVRRSTTTAAPVSKNRISSSRPKYRTISRSRASEEDEEDEQIDRQFYDSSSNEEENSERGNVVRSINENERTRNRNKSRPKGRSSSNRNRRKPIRRKEQTNDDSKEESLSNRLTTPEPPTTPDPGTDFKCEDEGFFPHPRDCKKYFWCLESGPGGLGVVAHQFTCPSGLVFNKAADSCDYPRNVACPKSKPSQSTVSTTRAPITAATSRTTYLYSTTRRSTSEKLNTEEDYEYYDEDDEEDEEEEKEEKEKPKVTSTPKTLLYKTITRNKSSTTTTTEAPSTTSKTDKHVAQKEIDIADEEDPKVIKELIMLIKKAGGIEQLEKQLLLQNKSPNNTASSGSENATPATISRTLYERVLNRQAGKIANRQRTPTNANGPGKAQFEGLDEVPEVKGLRRSQKPQYVTIERSKPSTKEPPTEDEDVDEEDVDEDNTDVASSEEQTISNPFLTSSTQRATPNYINIRRPRPSTSRNENDAKEKNKDEEEEGPIRRRRPGVSSKNTETSSENTKDQESRSATNEENSQTTKSRYVSVQRFRSTTPQSTEAVSEVASTSQSPITESVVSSEPPKIDQQVDTTTTTAVINIQPSIGLSSTPNDILIDPETEKPISTTTPEASSTTESVRLVEDSATEILLTTAPASSSTLSSPNTRISTATVSQPRPFGFNRRNRPSTEPTTTPLPSSNDQTRFKVSISSRNHTRSSPLVGRGRLRPKQENAGRNEPINENEQIESSRNVVEETPRSRGRSRGRGVSRYTPPTFRGKTEDPSDSVVRERTRTKENPTSTTINSDPPRRRFRRPTSRSTESTKVNELEDSPIVRIAQSYPRRSLSSRSGNVVKDEVDNEKITNIKVFKKPVSVNRDIYARTKYTRKRNNVETGERKKDTDASEEKSSEITSTLSYSSTSASTADLFANRSLNDTAATTVITTERPIVNSIDEVDQNSPQMTTTPRAQETTVSLDIETNTVETARTTESVVENEVVAVTDNNESDGREGLDEDLTTTSSSIKIENIDPDVIKIVFPMNSTEANIEGNVNAVPKRRKVVLRRRPVSTSTTAAREEEVENKPVPRRRKVIKRLRPVQNTASTVEDSSAEKDQILLRFESTTAKEDSTDTVAAEISDASTESFSSAMTETVAGTTDFDATNGFTEVTLETTPTAETMIDDSGFSNSDIITMASTIIDNITAIATESTTKEEESLTELGTTESTTSNFLINLTETDDILGETLPLRSDLDTSPTNSYDSVSQSTVSSFQPNRRLEVYNRTYYLDSRYVRKKFVRRRPIGSPPTENTTNNRHPITLTSTDVSSSNERGDLEVLSKRRKSLFVRRRPVSSTTTRTTRLIEQDLITDDKFDDEEDLRLEGQNESENATLRINRAHDETLYPAALSNGKESEEFWNHYTTSSNNGKHLYSVTPQRGITLYETSAKDVETALFENEETHRSSSNLSPEIGPRYRVPASLKKTVSTQGLYYLDSSSEDSEETSNLRTKYQNFRQPRTRYKYHEITRNRGEAKEESVPDATQSPSFDSSTHVRTRFYAKRPVSSTEPPVTETLIPAKKFDYAADAYRRQQSRRTTPRMQGEDSTTLTSLNEERAEVQNLVDGDYVTTPSPQPLVTRLVTSVEESATTERQKILIKTKYSSLTSTTKIPLQTTVARLDYPSTTVSPISGTLERSTDSSDEANEDESINEIRQAQVERSTLPIEGEFLYQARFTTESHESSTIEIESVFSNLIGSRDSTK